MSSATINSSLTVPVTDEQLNAFKTWARERYATHAAYNEAAKTSNNDINEYIITNILPSEMKAILVESEPFVGSRSTDLRVKEIQLNRRRVNNKVRYMKNKLGKSVFREEDVITIIEQRNTRISDARRRFRQILRVTNPTFVVAEERARHDRVIRSYIMRLLEEANFLISVYFVLQVNAALELECLQAIAIGMNRTTTWNHLINLLSRQREVVFKTTAISEEVASKPMKEDCSICLNNHEMNDVIEGPCGHQFGKYCFQEWTKKCSAANVGCPLCRGNCNQVTEFIVQGK